YRNDVLRAEIYPDSDDTTSLGNGTDGTYDRIEYTVNIQGDRLDRKDQNGTVHAYDHDKMGRVTHDRVTTLGTGVDGGVRRVSTTFDIRGLREKISTYDNATVGSGNVVNEVVLEYNDLGQATKEYQEHEGAKDANTLYVGYNRDTTASSGEYTKGLRLTSVRYPSGRLVHWTYGTSGGTGDVLNRAEAINDDSSGSPGSAFSEYTYLGSGRIVVEDYVQPDVRLTLDSGTAGEYAGLDRFGRVLDHLWYDYGASADRDRFTYGYDRASSRLYRENTVASAKDEHYTYDEVNRLATFDRGDLNANKDAISGTPVKEEDWGLDMTGNWTDFLQKTSGTTDLNQDRAHNPVNEITGITETTGTAWIDPVHDRAGNMTTVPKPSSLASGLTCKWDAWNRLVEVKDGATVVAVYEYDGLARRVKSHVDSQSPGNPDGIDAYVHFFYNQGWQELESRVSASENTGPESLQPQYQYVWSQRYIDAPILRDKNTDTDGLCDDERIYYLSDANFNVTTLIDTSGDALERYVYTPYGVLTIYDATWSNVRSTSTYSNSYTYTGRQLDAETGLFHYRRRTYCPSIAVFVSRDPIGYTAGQNLYRYVSGNPAAALDSYGLSEAGTSTAAQEPCTCGDFLAEFRSDPNDNVAGDFPHMRQLLHCNVNVFCSDNCGAGPNMAQTFTDGGYVHICIPNSVTSRRDFLGLLIHETQHASQYFRSNRRLCRPGQPWSDPNPTPGPLGNWRCRTCIDREEEAYIAQANYLFPSDADARRRFIAAGIYASCQHVCSERQLPNPGPAPAPELPPSGFFPPIVVIIILDPFPAPGAPGQDGEGD
ncbi:MAG: RHS repeat-associated core domain-containing protein, partial [Planctomycetes bacterium]|nr:RHS repeat-associated core domain-containing protein [Planctomycetota bacterium]